MWITFHFLEIVSPVLFYHCMFMSGFAKLLPLTYCTFKNTQLKN